MNLDGITLDPNLVKAIKELGFSEFTPIQKESIPVIQSGKDIIGQSSTGSGKTAAFGLPIVEKVRHGHGVQALILTPTRELCVQVASSLSDFSKYTKIKVAAVFGGVSINPQKDAIKSSEIVVGTPGRILDHLRSRSLKLDKIRFFVLDETDRMCDMGFFEDVEKIIRSASTDRQTLLFSATITRDVDKIVTSYMRDPVNVQGEQLVDPSLLEQVYYDVSADEKFSVLVDLLKKNTIGLSMVFCGTRRMADIVAKNLTKNGLNAMAIHGGLTQNRRLQAIHSLKNEHIDILVATDVAARGLDIGGVNFVYNYDVPKTPEEYIHRIGRTARAGKNGLAITLLAPFDHMNFRSVIRNSSLNIRNEQTPQVEIIPLKKGWNKSYERDGESGGHHFGGRRHGGHQGYGRGGHMRHGIHGARPMNHRHESNSGYSGNGAGQHSHSTHAHGHSASGEGHSHSGNAHSHFQGSGRGFGGKSRGFGGHRTGGSRGGRNFHPRGGKDFGSRGRGRNWSDSGLEGLSSEDYRDVSAGPGYRRRR